MNSVTSDTILQKFNILPENAKKEVADFIDFLIQKKKPVKKKLNKKKLLEVSCWSNEDIEAIEDAGKEINKWQPETF